MESGSTESFSFFILDDATHWAQSPDAGWGGGAATGEQLFGLVFPHVERLMTSLQEVANTNFNDWHSQIIPFFLTLQKSLCK